MTFQDIEDKKKEPKSPGEKNKKNQSPTKDWESEGLSFSPSTLEARRQRAKHSLFWGSEISNLEFHTQTDYKLNMNMTFSDVKQLKSHTSVSFVRKVPEDMVC